MMTEESLRALIARQAHILQSIKGSPLIPPTLGTLRGLIWVLTDAPAFSVNTAAQACAAAGIPYETTDNGKIVIDAEWRRANGVDLNLGSTPGGY
jgi:hypothetical protein